MKGLRGILIGATLVGGLAACATGEGAPKLETTIRNPDKGVITGSKWERTRISEQPQIGRIYSVAYKPDFDAKCKGRIVLRETDYGLLYYESAGKGHIKLNLDGTEVNPFGYYHERLRISSVNVNPHEDDIFDFNHYFKTEGDGEHPCDVLEKLTKYKIVEPGTDI